jgi:hypothetical protein
MFKSRLISLLFSLFFCTLLGCAVYSFKGALAPHLNTVAVPLFENSTAEFGVTEELTGMVVQEFSQDNSLSISDQDVADILIEGKIMRIEDRAGAFDPQETVESMRVYLTVAVKATDRVKKQPLWEERITQWGIYDSGDTITGRENALFEAMEKISEEILNKTVAGW